MSNWLLSSSCRYCFACINLLLFLPSSPQSQCCSRFCVGLDDDEKSTVTYARVVHIRKWSTVNEPVLPQRSKVQSVMAMEKLKLNFALENI
jgi:hypothetical protein